MEFLVDSGEGFVVSDEIDTEGWPIGYLAVDAIYTPIKKVNYRVEDTMVGRVTNYDKLVLEISTDGSIEIQDALSYAVELLKIHVNPFTNIGNNMSKFRGNEDEATTMNAETENNIEDMKIEELDFTVRSYNCLKKAGVNTISDLTSMSYIELLKIKNLGRKSLNEKLGRRSDHRLAMMKNMTISLVNAERIETTVTRAKELRKFVEKVITLGKKYNNFNLENNDERAKAIHLRRQAFAFLRNEEAVAKVFKEIAPKYMDRNGGYTRIIKTDVRRGDSAELAIIELV